MCGETIRDVGDSNIGLQTSHLKNNGSDWYYYDDEKWQNDDPTIQFTPMTTSSCLLQPSITLTSTDLTATTRRNYLGTFNIVQGEYSAGRPVWRNKRGRLLKMRRGYSSFGVYSGIMHTVEEVSSASGPTCPTDAKAGHSDKLDIHHWHFYEGGRNRNYSDMMTFCLIETIILIFIAA